MNNNVAALADKVYVLRGSTGSYDDVYDWLVCAYLTKHDAEMHREAAQKRATEIVENAETVDDLDVPNEWDAGMTIAAGCNVAYSVYEVPLRTTMIGV
jgi:hypothetical protein